MHNYIIIVIIIEANTLLCNDDLKRKTLWLNVSMYLLLKTVQPCTRFCERRLRFGTEFLVERFLQWKIFRSFCCIPSNRHRLNFH